MRELIDPQAPSPQYAGLISFGAAVSTPSAAGTRGRMPMILGKHAFFGYQVFDDGTAGWCANLPADHPLGAAEAGWHGRGGEGQEGCYTPGRGARSGSAGAAQHGRALLRRQVVAGSQQAGQ